MDTQDLSHSLAAGRALAWRAGGWLLIALGAGSFALAISGGAAFLLLALPPIVAGYAVLLQWRWSRWLGFLVAATYAVAIAYVAATPWRGLTPPHGQVALGIEAGMAAIAAAFVTAALLLFLGRVPSPPR